MSCVQISNIKNLLIKNKQIFLWLGLNTIFFFIYIYNLDKYPKLHIDEGYFSNPAYDLIKNGKFRTYIYGEHLRLDEFTFWQPPFYILLLALSFLIFGTSVTAGRMVSVILALILINFFFKITLKFLRPIMAFVLTFILGTYPLLFVSGRLIRMDIAVATFTFLSFYFLFFKYFNGNSIEDKKIRYLVVSGIFSALALLSHPNGLNGIILNMFGIILFDVKLKFKISLIRDFLQSIKEKKNELILYGITIFIVTLPYLIIIALLYDVFQVQFSGNIMRSIDDIWGNFLHEYLRYYGIIVPYYFESFFQFLPLAINSIFQLFLFSMFILGIFMTLILAFDENHKIAKIISIYIIGMSLLFAFIVSNKTAAYVCIIVPYPFLSIGYFFKNKDIVFNKFKNFQNDLLTKSTKFFDEKILKIYTVSWLILIILTQFSILMYYYNVNANQNTNKIRSILKENSVSKDDVIVANPEIYLPLYDYNFLHYNVLRIEFDNGNSIQEIVEEYDIKYFLYDDKWRSYKNDNKMEEWVNACDNYFYWDCILVDKFDSTVSHLDPIYLYHVNSTN